MSKKTFSLDDILGGKIGGAVPPKHKAGNETGGIRQTKGMVGKTPMTEGPAADGEEAVTQPYTIQHPTAADAQTKKYDVSNTAETAAATAETAAGKESKPPSAPAVASKPEAATPAELQETVEKIVNKLLQPFMKKIDELIAIVKPEELEEIEDEDMKKKLKENGIVGTLNATSINLEIVANIVERHDAFIFGHNDEERNSSNTILHKYKTTPSLVLMFDEVMELGNRLEALVGPEGERTPKILETINQPLMVVLVRMINAVKKEEDVTELLRKVSEIAVEDIPSDVKQILEALAKDKWRAITVLAGDENLTMEQLELPENAPVKSELQNRAENVKRLAEYCLKNLNWEELETAAAQRRASEEEQSRGDE